MIKYYLTLGVQPDSSDQEIRDSYIKLVKKYTPEKDPKKFHIISEAYENLKDERNRIKMKIFNFLSLNNHEKALMELANTVKTERKIVTLKQLLQSRQGK